MNDPIRLLRRIAVTVLGTALLAVGAILIVAPGPGILVIGLALAVFALEYEWARRRLAEVQELARSAAERTAASKIATATAISFGVAALGLGGALIFTDVLPFSGLLTGISIGAAGLIVIATTGYSIRQVRRAQPADPPERARDQVSR